MNITMENGFFSVPALRHFSMSFTLRRELKP